MQELDIMLRRFADRELARLSADELRVFAQLLSLPDPELAALLLRGEQGPDRELNALAARIAAMAP